MIRCGKQYKCMWLFHTGKLLRGETFPCSVLSNYLTRNHTSNKQPFKMSWKSTNIVLSVLMPCVKNVLKCHVYQLTGTIAFRKKTSKTVKFLSRAPKMFQFNAFCTSSGTSSYLSLWFNQTNKKILLFKFKVVVKQSIKVEIFPNLSLRCMNII